MRIVLFLLICSLFLLDRVSVSVAQDLSKIRRSPQEKEAIRESLLGFSDTFGSVQGIRKFVKEHEKVLREVLFNDTVIGGVCLDSVLAVAGGVEKGELWALEYLDSWGKPPAGILQGATLWIGDYDQCMGIERQSIAEEDPTTFGPQSCVAYLGPVDFLISLVVCAPDSCSPAQVAALVALVRNSDGENLLELKYVICQKETEFDTLAVVACVISGVFALIIAVGTVLDIHYRSQKKSADKRGKVNPPDGPDVKKTANATSDNAVTLKAVRVGLENESPTQKPTEEAVNKSVERNLPNDVHAEQFYENTEEDSKPSEVANGIDNEGFTSKDETPAPGPVYEDIAIPSKKEKEPNIVLRLLMCFSLYTNVPKLFSTETSGSTLRCIHGIRFFSMSWVILGHTYFFASFWMENKFTLYVDIPKEFLFHTILNGNFSVDTFFVLSGLLVTYLFMKQVSGSGKPKSCKTWTQFWFMFYFHRFWRLTPAYMLLMGYYTMLYPHLGKGAMWYTEYIDYVYCKTDWWKNLLYINNLWDLSKVPMCMGWTWYLATDMQMYWIAPLVLYALYKSKYFGFAGIEILILLHIVTSAVIASQNDVAPSDSDYRIYFKPWCRVGAYAVGMAVGYILFKTKVKPKFAKWQVALSWLLAAFLCLAPLYGLYGYWQDLYEGIVMPSPRSAAYISLSRISWSLGIAILVFNCINGYGGIIDTFLSWKALIPLSRLTYCAYLIHPIVQYAFFQSRPRPTYISHSTLVMYFFGFMVMTFMCSLVASLAFEAPMIGLEKIAFKKEKRRSSQK